MKRLPKAKIFISILNEEISDDVFSNRKSANDRTSTEDAKTIKEILQRIKVLTRLETLLDDNKTTFFKFDAKKIKGSKISADYMASSFLDGSQLVFSFFVKRDERNTSDHANYYVNSIFPFSECDYSCGQTSYTVLLKEKITDNGKVLLYKHKNFVGDDSIRC